MEPVEQVSDVLSQLPTELQQEVLDYAHHLLERQREGTAERPRFYICPVCFTAAKVRLECHGHLMIPCNAQSVADCRPPTDADGELKARAPQWFVDSAARPADSD